MQIREHDRFYSFVLAALTLVSAICFCRALAAPVYPNKEETARPWNRLVAIGAQFKPATPGTRIACVPVLLPGQSVFVTAVNSRNRAAADVSVMVNGMPVNTDLEGLAVFTAPDSGGLTLSLMDATHKVLYERKYVASAGKLVAQPLSGSLISRLLDASPPAGNAPTLIYAPLVTAPGLELMIIGHNLSANPEDVQVILDGVSIPVVSSSPVSCLCMVPTRTGIGPLKEIFVKVGDDPSTAREVDVANAELIYRETALEPGAIYHGRIQVIGTNFPCLLEIENRFPHIVNLSMPGSSTLPTVSSVLTPGGERNLVAVDIQVKEPVPFLVDVRILPNLPGAPGSEEYVGDSNFVNLVRQTNLGDITRLKRRLIAIDKRLATLKNTGPGPGDPAGQRKDKQEKVLKERRARLNNMLTNERQLFMSLGGTDNDYQKALDLAQSETQPTTSNIQPLPLPAQPGLKPASQAQR
ncbi:MAG: IPT/TIG domain-containing protein [Candidatus Obscuribacterales bacterium]|nr:IPT/TIG domain-containing protein [Candidatus Obscuribacterales bacterium]